MIRLGLARSRSSTASSSSTLAPKSPSLLRAWTRSSPLCRSHYGSSVGAPLSTSIVHSSRRVTFSSQALSAASSSRSRAARPRVHYSARSASSFSFFKSSSDMDSLVPPQAPPTWQHSPDQVTQITKDTIEQVKAVFDKVAALDPKDCTFESVCLISSS